MGINQTESKYVALNLGQMKGNFCVFFTGMITGFIIYTFLMKLLKLLGFNFVFFNLFMISDNPNNKCLSFREIYA